MFLICVFLEASMCRHVIILHAAEVANGRRRFYRLQTTDRFRQIYDTRHKTARLTRYTPAEEGSASKERQNERATYRKSDINIVSNER